MSEKVLQNSIYSRAHSDSLLFICISGLMLLLAFLGFGNSFFLRPLGDSPPLRIGVIFHGIVMTTWLVGFLLQTILINSRKFKAHRQLGWFLVIVGITLIIWGVIATLDFIPGRLAGGADIDSEILFYSSIVWGNFAAVSGFALFFGLAVIKRKNRKMHIPLMIFASLSMLEPALYRIWFWDLFGEVSRFQAHQLSLLALLILGLILVVYEYVNVRRVQAITLFAFFAMLGFRVIYIYLISDSELGLTFIRSLY